MLVKFFLQRVSMGSYLRNMRKGILDKTTTVPLLHHHRLQHDIVWILTSNIIQIPMPNHFRLCINDSGGGWPTIKPEIAFPGFIMVTYLLNFGLCSKELMFNDGTRNIN